MSNFLKNGTIPTWRVVCWGIFAGGCVDGLIYFISSLPNNSSRHTPPWAYLTGVVIAVIFSGIGFILNWTQTERTQSWVRSHPRAMATLMTILIAAKLLLHWLHQR